MKQGILYLLLFFGCQLASAQSSTTSYGIDFAPEAGNVAPDNFPIPLSVQLSTPLNYGIYTPNDSLLNSFLYDRPFINKRRNRNLNAQGIYNSAPFYILFGPIDKQNISKYRIRISRNKQTGSDWQPLDTTQSSLPGAWKQCEIGTFSLAKGEYLLIDVQKTSDSLLTSILIYWQDLKPVLYNIFTTNSFPEFINQIRNGKFQAIEDKEKEYWAKMYNKDELDTVTHLPKKLIVQPEENSLIFLLNANITGKNAIEYQLQRDGTVYTSWRPNEAFNEYVWLKSLPPGDYKLRIRYTLQPQHVLTYPFVVKAAWYQTLLFKIVMGILILAFLGAIVLLWRLQIQKRKSAVETFRKNQLTIGLQSLQAQLNPHFVFNALNSIQGLINTNRVQSASQYLSEFGNLLRASLDTNDKEFTTLDIELNTIKTYLHLEQLRFGFRYSVEENKRIRLADTEFPALLLQPLVENSVKHGVASKDENGNIHIMFDLSDKDLVVSVSDNGQGFDVTQSTNGYGLRLTEKRLEILNKLLAGRSISMTVFSAPGSGTVVKLTFINWLI